MTNYQWKHDEDELEIEVRQKDDGREFYYVTGKVGITPPPPKTKQRHYYLHANVYRKDDILIFISCRFVMYDSETPERLEIARRKVIEAIKEYHRNNSEGKNE